MNLIKIKAPLLFGELSVKFEMIEFMFKHMMKKKQLRKYKNYF